MPNSTISPRKSRLIWIIVAGLIALILFIGNVAGNLIASDLDAMLKPHRRWVWVVFGIALFIAVALAIREALREDAPKHSSADVDKGEQHSATHNSDTSKPDQIIHLYNAPVPTGSALHQLPTPPSDFTGRAQELDELMRALEQGGVTISGLQGLGGVGKTTLALKLAQQLTSRYPDAQFYLDLKGTSKTPLSASDAMAHIIRAYQPTAKLPEGEAELSGQYRSVLHNQRALLLMDNAADDVQVKPLIPPDSCVMLVTSRQHFTLPGLFAKNLDALPAEDARKLLLKIAPRINEQADTIAKLCGYLPLALRLAASALAERIDLSVADYVRRLSNVQQRLKLIDASLSLSYELLSPEMQERWCVLAIFPDAFDSAAATAAWEIEMDATQDALSELVKYSLLEWDEATVRYRLHDLARLFADAHLSETERDKVQRSHASHYLSVIREANKLYRQGGEELKRGLVLFDLEWPNIQAGQAWAEKYSGEDHEAASLCSGYSNVGSHLLDIRLYPRKRIPWLKSALISAQRLKDRTVEAIHLCNLGNAYWRLGELPRAVEFYKEQLAIALEIKNRRLEGSALEGLAWVDTKLGDTQRALEFYEQAVTINREIGDRHTEANILLGLGNLYIKLGETEPALKVYKQALSIAREIGDRRNESNALGSLGLAYNALGDSDQSIKFYEQSLEIAREIGNHPGESNALWNLSLLFDKLGKRDQAIAHAEAALKIKEQIEAPNVAKVREQLTEWRGQGNDGGVKG
jgi:tetratricopeptide (TPR) repeat protein